MLQIKTKDVNEENNIKVVVSTGEDKERTMDKGGEEEKMNK